MKRKALIRGLLGFPEGIAIGMGITILISLAIRDGSYHPCVPSFVSVAGSEIAAVIIQTLLCGLLGSVYAAASVVWDVDSWSIARQSGVFFAVAAVAMMSIGYILHWMDHSASGILSFFLVFFAVFVVIWLAMYLVWRRKIRELNRDVEKIRNGK